MYMYMYMYIHVMLVVHVYFCNSYGTFDVHWLMDYDMSILGQDEEGECAMLSSCQIMNAVLFPCSTNHVHRNTGVTLFP